MFGVGSESYFYSARSKVTENFLLLQENQMNAVVELSIN